MASKDDIVIVAALRTAVGNFNGSFANLPAHELGKEVLKALIAQTNVAPQHISEVILAQVLNAAQGQNPARQASIKAGLPIEVPAWGINQVCGSGLRAVAIGMQGILLGDSDIVIAGGQESMSMAPHAVYLRGGVKFGNVEMIDTMIRDGLWEAFNNYHMGNTAENLVKQYGLTRDDQDAFAAESQKKAFAAQQAGKFKDEIVPVQVQVKKDTVTVDKDEFIRGDTTAESLAKLRPAFDKEGSVTAGNASGINDGAAAVMIMKRSEAEKRGLPVLARIASWAQAGVEPKIMGIGPVPAARKALEKAGWTHEQLDLIEANEAFAAQAVCVNREIGWDTSKVNVNGGAIAIGHPIGASGARILVTLLHEMKRRDAKKGLATLCVGGGMGVALCVERN